MSHEQVFNLLKEAEELIDFECVHELQNFREVAYDIFELLDSNNDGKLRKFWIDKKGDQKSTGMDEDFWSILTESYTEKDETKFTDWIKDAQKNFKFEMEYKEF